MQEIKEYIDKIFNDDCLNILKNFPDNSIDLTVTSPPYDKLRTYENNPEFDFENIAKELYRVTKNGGILVWVVGDSTVNGSESCTSFEQALFFKKIGFKLYDTMIYAKENPIPQNHRRYEQAFEYMFVFLKGKRPNTFNALTEPTKNAGKIFNWGDRKTKMDDNQCRRHRDTENLQVKETKIRKNIWYYSVGGGRTGHPAVFPEKLAEDHILTWSNEGDIILDPCLGSGTTAKMAKKNNRHYIGIELNSAYIEMIEKNMESLDVT